MTDFAEALLTLIRERRSIRRFQPRPVPATVIDRLLEAANWAPSAHNRQPWRFVVVTGEQVKERLAVAMTSRLAADLREDGVSEELISRDVERSHRRITGAPASILVCLSMVDMDSYPDAHRQRCEHIMAIQSVAMAAQNLLLMAHAQGLGACWTCAPLFCPDVVRETLDLPDDYEPQGLVLLGYLAEHPIRTRQPLSNRVILR